MKSKYNKYYDIESQPIGYYAVCNFGGLAIFDIIDIDSDTYVIVGDYYDKPENIRRHKLYTTKSARNYFIRQGHRFYLDEFMRVDFYGEGLNNALR